jgi:hypothetical protein
MLDMRAAMPGATDPVKQRSTPMFTSSAIGLAAIVLTAAVPGGADKPDKAAPAQSASQADPNQRYCIVGVFTGTIRNRICKTRQQWISQDGFDPTAPKDR